MPLPGAIQLPDCCWVRGRGLRLPVPEGPQPEFGLYLGTKRLRRQHELDLPWAQEWISWPDFLVPLQRRHAATAITALHVRARGGQLVEVACSGGVGRTGTVIACLATLAGLSPAQAITWTRTHYQPRAIETPWQRHWITTFQRHGGAESSRHGGASSG